ncbi:MAG TPA: diphthine synthase [Thermoplasmata archaeon]|nr:diphthine synthase [Thermoplasmata archaeon]
MAELWFIGWGLDDETGLSSRARAVLRSSSVILAEEYTSQISASGLDRLSAELGRPILRLTRAELESEAPVRAALETHPRVALLIGGDPFVATTHVALRLSVETWGHTWCYLPNATVLTAVPSLLGLMHYRFGRTVSLPFPAPNFAPRSPLAAIARNLGEGLHTLVLLDLRPEEGRYMPPADALRMLSAPGDPPPPLTAGTLAAVVARAGTDQAAAWYGPWEELVGRDFGPPLHAVVVPAPELHFEEAAAIERFRVGAVPRKKG